MLVKEMHVEFDLLMQKAASNQYGNLSTSEVDRLLNQAQLEYIENRFRGVGGPKQGDYIQQKRLDDVRRLIVKNKKLELIAPSENPDNTDSYFYEPNMVYAHLPNDYLFLINSRSYTASLEDTTCDAIGKETVQDNYIEYISVLKFNGFRTFECDGGTQFTIELVNAPLPGGGYGNITVFDLEDYPEIAGIKEESDKFKIVNLMLEVINRVNASAETLGGSFSNSYNDSFDRETANKLTWLEVYWEQYQDRYYKDCFIFVTRQLVDILEAGSDNALTVWRNAYNTANGTSYTDYTKVPDFVLEFNENNHGIEMRLTAGTEVVNNRFLAWGYDQLIPSQTLQPSQLVYQWGNNRHVHLGNIYQLLNHPFNPPTAKRPIATLAANRILVYDDNSFVNEDLVVDYLRTPRSISLLHGWSCELPMQTHTEIVNRAVEIALNITQSPRVQIQRQRNDQEL